MTLPDYAARLRRSQKFLSWRRHLVDDPSPVDGSPDGENRFVLAKPQVEKHFSPKELASSWGVDSETIRYVFMGEKGVVKFDRRVSDPNKSLPTLRIPESVAVRVHRRLSE